MSNILFGIITILLSTTSAIISWRFFKKENYNLALLFLILLGLILRIYTSADLYLHEWDERYHALVAKNLIQHPLTPTLYDQPVLPYNYQDWASSHIWVHKQPVPLWSISLSMYLFGINEIALRLPSILISTLGIGLIFSIGSYFINRKAGYISAFLFAINGLILELTGGRVATDHIDVYFLFFVLLGVYFSVKFVQNKKTIYNILVGISIGLAILTKWLPALIVLPIWLLIVYDAKNFNWKKISGQFVLIVIVTIAIALPWQLYIYSYFPMEAEWEASFNVKHFTEALEGRGGSIFYFIDRIRINYGELIYIPLIWFIWKIVQKPIDLKRIALFMWFIVPLLFFSFAKTKMQGYLLFTSPALFLITADFWTMLYQHSKEQKLRWIYSLILILMIALPIRYSIERMKPFDNKDSVPKWVANLKELGKNPVEKGVLFNYNRPIEAMFYTNLTVYHQLPDKAKIEELMNEGFTVLVNIDETVPKDIQTIKEVKFVEL